MSQASIARYAAVNHTHTVHSFLATGVFAAIAAKTSHRIDWAATAATLAAAGTFLMGMASAMKSAVEVYWRWVDRKAQPQPPKS